MAGTVSLPCHCLQEPGTAAGRGRTAVHVEELALRNAQGRTGRTAVADFPHVPQFTAARGASSLRLYSKGYDILSCRSKTYTMYLNDILIKLVKKQSSHQTISRHRIMPAVLPIANSTLLGRFFTERNSSNVVLWVA